MTEETCLCFKCEQPMPNVNSPGFQPMGGSEFTTRGAYGSAVTDHMDGRTYAISICDECLTSKLGTKFVHIYAPAAKEASGAQPLQMPAEEWEQIS